MPTQHVPASAIADYERNLTDPGDMEHLARLHEAALFRPWVIELGVRTGVSTSAFLAAAERAGGYVWSVDIESPRVPAHWADSGLWTMTVGDDLTVPLPGGRWDLLFIDTSHERDHTLAELERYAPLLRPGGLILAHDTAWFPGVREALDDWCGPRSLAWLEWGGRWGMGEVHAT